MSARLPAVGSRLRIWHGDRERWGLILSYDPYEESVHVRWYEYPWLPTEWIPTRWLA